MVDKLPSAAEPAATLSGSSGNIGAVLTLINDRSNTFFGSNISSSVIPMVLTPNDENLNDTEFFVSSSHMVRYTEGYFIFFNGLI